MAALNAGVSLVRLAKRDNAAAKHAAPKIRPLHDAQHLSEAPAARATVPSYQTGHFRSLEDHSHGFGSSDAPILIIYTALISPH
jgi:hypothetical protein